MGEMSYFITPRAEPPLPFPDMPQQVRDALEGYACGSLPRLFKRSTGMQGGVLAGSFVPPAAEEWLAGTNVMVGTAPAFLAAALTTLCDAFAAEVASATSNKQLGDLMAACAMFHNTVMAMMPLVDGNGRLARGVVNYVLVTCNMQPLICTSLYNAALLKDLREIVYRDPLHPIVDTAEMVKLLQRSQIQAFCWACGKPAVRRCAACNHIAFCADCSDADHPQPCRRGAKFFF